MHSAVFVDQKGNKGEIMAGANHAQAQKLIDSVFAGRGAASPKIEQAAMKLGLEAPIARYKIVRRPGAFTEVGIVGQKKEAKNPEPVREEPVRISRKNSRPPDLVIEPVAV